MSQLSSSKRGAGPQAVGPSPVDAVLLVDRYERPAGHRAVASSLPGHLVQLTLRGRTRHEVNGRRYTLRAGDLIWYHEDETVHVAVEAPYVFYTLNFIAPRLAPPPFERRVRPVGASVKGAFACLLAAWRGPDTVPMSRELAVQSALAELLRRIVDADPSSHPEPFAHDPAAQLWWRVETLVRRDLSRPVTLGDLTEMVGRSPATIARSCVAAVSCSPMKRIKRIRMSMARGLVRDSPQSISQIAAQVGYPRVHEFSRDYRKHFGQPPTWDRRDAAR